MQYPLLFSKIDSKFEFRIFSSKYVWDAISSASNVRISSVMYLPIRDLADTKALT